jgi:uncharacterized protein
VRLPKFRWLRVIKALLFGCILLFLGSIYAYKIEPFWFEVKQINITLPHLDREFVGYRIVQLADLHAGAGIDRAQLDKIIDATNAQQPDLVVLTGDQVTRSPRQHLELLTSLSRLHPRDRTLAIFGNHEAFDDLAPIRAALQIPGITLLENTVYTLQRGGASLHIAGVGDVWAKQARLDRVLAQLPPNGAAIILAHEPDFADRTAASGRFGLQLSGHSHGGQIRLPFLTYFPDYAVKYPIGRYQVGEMIQYTSRGLGMGKLYARFNCRPEISVFTLS